MHWRFLFVRVEIENPGHSLVLAGPAHGVPDLVEVHGHDLGVRGRTDVAFRVPAVMAADGVAGKMGGDPLFPVGDLSTSSPFFVM